MGTTKPTAIDLLNGNTLTTTLGTSSAGWRSREILVPQADEVALHFVIDKNSATQMTFQLVSSVGGVDCPAFRVGADGAATPDEVVVDLSNVTDEEGFTVRLSTKSLSSFSVVAKQTGGSGTTMDLYVSAGSSSLPSTPTEV